MEQTACNLCGSTNATNLYSLQDYLLNRPDVITQLVRCDQCGLVYQNPRPTLSEVGQHYPPEYESYVTGSQTQHQSWLYRQAVQYGITKRAHFVTCFKKSGRLLDIGCAAGIFLSGFLEKPHQPKPDWDLYGVELNEYAASKARDFYGLNVFTGTLEQAKFGDAFFDGVTLWDVLEHLHDPSSTIQEIRRILKPDGYLIMRIPNGASLDAREFGQYWAGLDAPRHLYVFTPQTIHQMLSQNGFEVVNWSGQSGSYPTYLLSMRFRQTARGSSAWGRSLIRALSHPVVRLVSAPLFYLRSLGLSGTQMVVTATLKDNDKR